MLSAGPEDVYSALLHPQWFWKKLQRIQGCWNEENFQKMTPANKLHFAIRDIVDEEAISPSRVPLSLLGEFQKDVSDFLKGSNSDVEPSAVMVSVEKGSLAFVVQGVLAATTLWGDLSQLGDSNSLDNVDSKRAAIVEKWQSKAKSNLARSYSVLDENNEIIFNVDSSSHFIKDEDVWFFVEKYLYGRIVDMGGKTKANVHLELENGDTVTIESSIEFLAKSEKNNLYRNVLLHVTAEENLNTGLLRNLHLLQFENYNPEFNELEYKKMVETGTSAWSGIADAQAWLEDLRGGGE